MQNYWSLDLKSKQEEPLFAPGTYRVFRETWPSGPWSTSKAPFPPISRPPSCLGAKRGLISRTAAGNRVYFSPLSLDRVIVRSSVIIIFKFVNEILRCYHSNETSFIELLRSVIHFLGFSEKKFVMFCRFLHWTLLGATERVNLVHAHLLMWGRLPPEFLNSLLFLIRWTSHCTVTSL